jgi:hypothetical protein
MVAQDDDARRVEESLSELEQWLLERLASGREGNLTEGLDSDVYIRPPSRPRMSVRVVLRLAGRRLPNPIPEELFDR